MSDPSNPENEKPTDESSEGIPPVSSENEPDPYADAKDAGRGEVTIYALGGIIDEFATSGFRSLNTLLLIVFQMNPLILGLISAIKSIWDGIMDPIVAHLSDNFNSRFGRRRPFILAGGVMMALTAWITWQFMPENDKMLPNDPVVPEVYHADELWKDFGELSLAYGVPGTDIEVVVEPGAASTETRTALKNYAEEAVKTLGGETKALYGLRSAEEEVGEDPPPLYSLVVEAVALSETVNPGPGDDAVSDSFNGRLQIALRGPGIKTESRSVVDFRLREELVPALERDVNFLNTVLYFFLGAPEKIGLELTTEAQRIPLNVERRRAGERALKAAIETGAMELLSERFGLPLGRITPEVAEVSPQWSQTVKERAMERWESEPDFFEKLLISHGTIIDLSRAERTPEEAAAIREFLADYPEEDERSLTAKLYGTVPIKEAAGRQATLLNPEGVREFKGIWEKIAEGLSAYVGAEGAQERRFIWFVTGMFLLMAIAQTLYGAAYYAQGIEIAPSYKGRTQVVAYRSVSNTLINFLTQLFLPLSLMPIFLNARLGNLYLTYVLAPIGIVLALVVFFGTKERTVVIRDKTKKGPGFFTAVREIGINPEFWRILGMYIFIGYAIGSFQGLGHFLSVYYIFEGNLVAGASYGAAVGMISTIMSLVTIPVFVYLCNRIGKHNTLRLGLGSLALASVVKYWCYNPDIPELMFIPALLYSPAISIFYKVLGTLMGDVTDYDELLHGERREGMFGAVMAIIMKSLGAFTGVATGLIIVLSGFEQGKGMHQDPGVFHNMLVLYSIVPGIAACGGFLIFRKFKLTEERVIEIKKQLAVQRRQKAEAAEAPKAADEEQ